MRNAITGTRLVVLVTVLLLVSESALVQSEPAPETKSVSAWLKEWGEDVHYSVSYDREHDAYKALRELGPAAVAPLIQALGQSTGDSTQDWWTRDNAAFVLGDIGPAAKAGVLELVALLDSKRAEIRRWAANVLGRIGPDAYEAVPKLLDCLKDEAIRGRAAEALGEIGADATSAVPALIELLKEENGNVQRSAVVGLGNFGGAAREAVPFLFPLLEAADKTMRKVAAWALREIEPEESVSIERRLESSAAADLARYEAGFRQDPGLSCRAVTSTNRIEQGMPLKILFEVWSITSELPHGVTHLNAFFIREYLKLHLAHQVTQQTRVLDIEPVDFPNPEDEGREAKLLDGTRLGPWEAVFRLVRLRDSLEPGTYDCWVEFDYPKNKTKRWYRKTAADWGQFGFCSGRIWSPSFQLEVLKEARGNREFVVRGQPRLEKGLDGRWRLTLKKDE